MILNCTSHLLDLREPVVMGILNATPDSFFAESRVQHIRHAMPVVETMLHDGARIIDIGGVSTRPGASDIPLETELARVLPLLEALVRSFPGVIFSIDTFRSEVARQAVEAGASMINDVSGGQRDDNMFATVARLNVPYVLTHSRGTPANMQQLTDYQNLIIEVTDFFIQNVQRLRAAGVTDIVLDPGFGFAKTIDQNFELLQHLHVFRHILDLPVLAGISRKSMIWKTLGTTPDAALSGTAALHMVALQHGASILRAHDVRAAQEVVVLWKKMSLQDGFAQVG